MTNLLIRKAPFQRLDREITRDSIPNGHFQKLALDTLQEAAEAHLVGVFKDSNLCTIPDKCDTVFRRDMRFTRRIRLGWCYP